MSTIYTVTSSPLSPDGLDIIDDFDNERDAYDKIMERMEERHMWACIRFEIYNRYGKYYDSMVWKNPGVKFDKDYIMQKVE